MGIFKRFRKENRVSVNDDHFWPEFFQKFGLGTKSGQTVTPDSSLQVSAVYACTRVLAESIASLPLNLFQRLPDGSKEIARNHPIFKKLHDKPNDIQTSYEFREMLMGHTVLRGNAFAFKEINVAGQIINLIPLDPSRMQIEKDGNVITYIYTHEDGRMARYPSEFIWHWRGLSSDGIVGLSPVTLARESIGLSMAAEDHGALYFKNNATPSGVLEYPGKLQEDARKLMKDSLDKAHTDSNKFKTMILEGGLKWTAMGMSNQDSQFIESRNFQVEDIARIFRVPSIMINHPDKTATYASAEQFFLNFVVHTIQPWAIRIEQSANIALLSEADQNEFFFEFNLNGLLRGDSKSRNDSYAVARQWGWMSVNDIRKLENMNPIGDEGDIYLQPLNMVDAEKALTFVTPPKKEPEPQRTESFVLKDGETIPIGGTGGNDGN